MRRVEWQKDLDKLKEALWEYIQCLNSHYDKKTTKIEIVSVVNEILNDYYSRR